jgi:polyisoprenoid-binding protein YceI
MVETAGRISDPTRTIANVHWLVATFPKPRATSSIKLPQQEPTMRAPLAGIASIAGTICLLSTVAGCQNPADDVAPATVSAPKPSATRESSPGGSAAAPTTAATPASKTAAIKSRPAGAEALTIDPATSKVGFVGSKVSGSHNGGFKSFQGTWALVADKPESSLITAEIAMDSLWTDTDRLTGHLKSPDFFDIAKFPKATFETTEIRKGSTDAKAKDATHTVTGNLALHGVTKSIQFPARLAVTPKDATLDSEFFLNRKDFGIVYPGMPNDLIREEVVIKLAIHAPRKS